MSSKDGAAFPTKDERLAAARRRDALVARIADIVRRSGVERAEELIAELEREWPRPDPYAVAIDLGVELWTEGLAFDLAELDLPWDVKQQVTQACADRSADPEKSAPRKKVGK